MVDTVTEQTLFNDLAKGDDSRFAKDFAAVAWNERAEYARDLSAQLDANRSAHPELPSLTVDIQSYQDYMGQNQEYVSSIKAAEERSWFNPRRYLSGSRTEPYEIYSPAWAEKIKYGVNRYLKTPM